MKFPKFLHPCEELDEADIFRGLVNYGLFNEKVPPCFTTEGLVEASPTETLTILDESDERKLKDALSKSAHDYIRYDVIRDINIPRHFGIPHPESYVVQALAIKKHWLDLREHFKEPEKHVSQIFVRFVDGNQIFEMSYKGAERFEVEEELIQNSFGCQFTVHADISKCFPSIYTHSIPWALKDRSAGKKERSLSVPGNLLDRCTQITRDNQTNGILIGPHASNIISEIVLSRVDEYLLKKGYTRLTRHIDDYKYLANDFADAEAFIRELGLSLRDYELSLNEKKTKIVPMPEAIKPHWIRELNSFRFTEDGKGEVRFNDVRSFLDLALDLSKSHETSAVFNYAFKMMPRNLNERARRLFAQEALNIAIMFPYLAPIMQEYVFEKFPKEATAEKIQKFGDKLVELGIKQLHSQSIAFGIYYVLKYKGELDQNEEALLEIIKIGDCISVVMLFEYAKRHKLDTLKKAIRKHARTLLKADKREQDKQWLLIYQVWTVNELKGETQPFLAHLKEQKFKFINPKRLRCQSAEERATIETILKSHKEKPAASSIYPWRRTKR